jgi:hypothetical protein
MGLTTYFSEHGSHAGLFNYKTSVTVPDISGGLVATLQIRTWETKGGLYTSYASAYEGATGLLGEGNLVQVTLGVVPMPPPNMVGIAPIVMHAPVASLVPEPRALAIAGLGLTLLLGLRRYK